MLGDFIIAIFVLCTLVAVMVPVINYNSDIDTTFIGRSFVQSKTVVLYYHYCGITDQFFGCKYSNFDNLRTVFS